MAASTASSAIAISSKQVAYRTFWNTPEDLGLWEAKSSDGVPVLVTDPLDMRADVSRDAYANVLPATGLMTTISSGAPIQFRIQPATCAVIDEMYVDWTFTESGGVNSVTPGTFPNIVNRIEIGVNGSSAQNQIIYGEHFYTQYMQYSFEDMLKATFKNQLNMGPFTFGGELAIPAGGSVTYSMPLHVALCVGEMNFNTIAAPIILNFYLNASPIVAGSGTLTQTYAQLRIKYRTDPYYGGKQLALSRALPTLLTFMNMPIQNFPATLTSGVQTKLLMTGINDYTSALLVIVRAAATYTSFTPNASGIPGIRDYLDLAGTTPLSGFLDVLATSGTSIYTQTNIITPDYMRSQEFVQPKGIGTMTTVVPFYMMSFCKADMWRRTLDTAICSGGYLFTGELAN